ncbi:MAG TPA: hypothetical protein VMF13_00510 [Luteitalea sp.]|nr:hypothetical protein [Luteitalea sp.]
MAACPVCGGGKAKRSCPALGQVICATCCGTKRQIEIHCPDGCGWLQAARAHPHAALQRQQERDSALVVPLVEELSDTEYGVLMTCLQAAVTVRPDIAPPPLDTDLEQAAVALAATAETATRGVLYEHHPEGPVAARLALAMREALIEPKAAGVPRLDAATSVALRRLVDVMQAYRRSEPEPRDGFFAFLGRVLQPRFADGATGRAIDPTHDPRLAGLGASDLAGPASGPLIVIP